MIPYQQLMPPRPLPAYAQRACVPYAVANIRNTNAPYELQDKMRLNAVSFCAAARYFDFWTEVISIGRYDTPNAVQVVLEDYLRAPLRGADMYLFCGMHTQIPTFTNPPYPDTKLIPHFVGLLVGAQNWYVIDAINGLARLDYSPDAYAAARDFAHFFHASRIALEIDHRDANLAATRVYHPNELSHIINAQPLSQTPNNSAFNPYANIW